MNEAPKPQTDPTEGRKFDQGKLRYGLLPPFAIQGMVEILTMGAKKYAPDNWKYVEDSKARYVDAAMRHFEAYRMGEHNDPESGKPHLYHLLCCVAFLAEHEYAPWAKDPAFGRAEKTSAEPCRLQAGDKPAPLQRPPCSTQHAEGLCDDCP